MSTSQKAQSFGRTGNMKDPIYMRKQATNARLNFVSTGRTFELPDKTTTYNGLVLVPIAALCMCLMRYTYPCRYEDLASIFSWTIHHGAAEGRRT